MAATCNQRRWKQPTEDRGLMSRITRSARMLGRSTLASADPGRVGEELLRNAVSPHWKRISAAHAPHAVKCPPAAEDDVPARRRAVLVSDFRFVSKSRAQRSAQLESEFERFAHCFGAVEGEVAGEAEAEAEAGSSLTRIAESQRQSKPGKKVSFVEEDYSQRQCLSKSPTPRPNPNWHGGFFQDEMLDDFHPPMESASWTAPLPPTAQPSSMPHSAHTDDLTHHCHTWTRLWEEGSDSSETYQRTIEDALRRSVYGAHQEQHNPQHEALPSSEETEDTSTVITEAAASFIDELAIPDQGTKQIAVERLKDVERHLSYAQDLPTLSLQDEHLLYGPLDHSSQLLSASLGTAVGEVESDNTTAYYFYCPHLECHRRLVYQNARLQPSVEQRCCVHTGCGFVSHTREGWIRHCTQAHHEYAKSHEACECCYSNEDTH